MARYILRRLGQSVLTIFGVMLLTFLLFRGVAGDIAQAHLGPRATVLDRVDWLHRYGYDKPTLVNLHSRLAIEDRTAGLLAAAEATTATAPASSPALPATIATASAPTTTSAPTSQEATEESSDDEAADAPTGPAPLRAESYGPVKLADGLGLIPSDEAANKLIGRYVWRLGTNTQADKLTGEERVAFAQGCGIVFHLADRSELRVDLSGVRTCGELIGRIAAAPGNDGRLVASISERGAWEFFDSQFFKHLWTSMSFQAVSIDTKQPLTQIIVERAPKSLAITVPALVLGWILSMVLSCLVAYYRGTLVDKLGVFMSVLGMCIPFLAFMIYGQWLMFVIAPAHAYGLFYRTNVYVPVLIMVLADIGPGVRFYRTIILDEINKDYVRTARAKGLPLTTILFKHVLKNCMLPILTNLVVSLPFLIMGSLLVETYFGIPGLGDLLLSSFNTRDEPVLNALVFLTALIYTVGLLLTDVLYAVFDPRIRLR